MIPKDLTGKELIKMLKIFGYEIVRQNGSHIRIQTEKNGKHSETIPNHSPIKQGTLRKILKNIAQHFNITLEELETQLF
jgi:predicted RNA binding protein YcfA (HicA-like mRNA interferase family)